MNSVFKSAIAKFILEKSDKNKHKLIFKISRKYGNAPSRNRIKRLFREAFRLELADCSNHFEIVIVPFKLPYKPTFDIVKKEVRNLIDKKICSNYNCNL